MKAFLAAAVILLVASGGAVLADEAEQVTGTTAELTARARACFRRGIELYDEQDFGAANVEFRHAYALVRNFRILFNLGRTAFELHDYAAASDAFTRYLAEGGDEIRPDRRHEVEEELSRLRSRVGTIKLVVDEDDEEVYLDDVFVGRTPLAPLAVNVGRHRLEVRSRGHLPEVRLVDVPGEEMVATTIDVAPSLPSPTATAAPAASVAAAKASPQPKAPRGPWLAWTATGLCAVGAVTLGVLAYRSSQELRDMRQSYPVSSTALADKQRATRILAGVADGLAVGTVILAGVGLYVSLAGDSAREQPGLRVGLGWPGTISLSGRY